MLEDDRPPFVKNCPVCNAETPPGSITCPKCNVNLEIARTNFVKDLALQVGKVGYAAGQYSSTPAPENKKRKITFGSVVGFIMSCVFLLVLLGIIKDAFPYMLIPLFQLAYPEPTYITPTSGVASLPAPKPSSLTKIAELLSPTQNPCLLWSEVTTQMNGQTVCVYGTVYQITSSRETQTRIEFSDQPNTFFLYSVRLYFTDETTGKELMSGDCVSMTGKVGIISNVPYIDIKEELLYHCD